MTCTLVLTILIMNQSFVVERDYNGKLIDINPHSYKIDFTGTNDWLKGVFEVPKSKCTKS